MADIPAPLDDILGFHIRLAHGAVYRHFNETFGSVGLTQKQTSVLWLVSGNREQAQADIARLLQIDRATMMAITNSLTQRGLLKRRPSSTDRRRQTLHLTGEGEAALKDAVAAIVTHEAWLKSRFKPEETLLLMEFLKRIHT